MEIQQQSDCDIRISIERACALVVAIWLLRACRLSQAKTRAMDPKPSGKIGLDEIRKLAAGKTVWDRGIGAVAGFGARRQKGDSIAYVVKYRTADGRQRWDTIGRHRPPWTPDLARAEAKRILGKLSPERIRRQKRRSRASPQQLRSFVTSIWKDVEPAASSLGGRPQKDPARSTETEGVLRGTFSPSWAR
jgi:hypothetical protein